VLDPGNFTHLGVPWSPCLCVCQYADYTDELCKNGGTDRDAVWVGHNHVDPINLVLVGVHIGSTLQIQLKIFGVDKWLPPP